VGALRLKPLRIAALVLGSLFLRASVAGQQEGVRYVGRWLNAGSAPVATYAGSSVVFSFAQSSKLEADFSVSHSKGYQPLYIAVTVDGGKPVRMALTRGHHRHVLLAHGLSAGPHEVVVRKEGEPYFGALQMTEPALDIRWQHQSDDRPIVEVIGDSDATGICALGPDSPDEAVSIYTSAWASETASWVGLLESDLQAVGYPVAMVDLAISGSTTGSEARSYDEAAPGYSDAKFGEYPPPGRKHASVVLMWGGANDRHAGGDLAAGSLTYGHLSRFQQGVYDQLTKIFARNPDVKVVLLGYIDPTIPDWKPAYDQVVGMFPPLERSRILFLRVYDPPGESDACEIDPKGHPNLALHTAWAGQILAWMLSKDVMLRLGVPGNPRWSDH
jgi:hypothetical protein